MRYIYDGNLVLQERWLDYQLSTNNYQQFVTYTRGRDLSGSREGAGGIGGLLARSSFSFLLSSFSSAYYHADGNGNITCLINTNQAIIAEYLYDPYGNILSQRGPLSGANLYRFSSKEIHTTALLVYYLYRYCDSTIQRWLNRDPLGESGGKHLYAFNANSPIARCDRDGYAWVSTGKPPPDRNSTVVCRNGKPVPLVGALRPEDVLARLQAMVESDKRDKVANPRNPDAELKGYMCAQNCAYQHGQSHVKDILAQNPNICVGVANGTTIANNDPNTDLLNSEQRAHQVEADCLANCKKTCPSSTVDHQSQLTSDWLKDHQYE